MARKKMNQETNNSNHPARKESGESKIELKSVLLTQIKNKQTKVELRKSNKEFYIVGIGASAGGLEAFEEFFTHMPADSGMAFVLVLHFAPTYKSLMPDLLMKYTEMDVYHERSLFVSICCHSELGSESQKEDISEKRDA